MIKGNGCWKCVDCGKRDIDVCYSSVFNCYLCDSCYTDRNDALEDERLQANIDACYSNGEQDG